MASEHEREEVGTTAEEGARGLLELLMGPSSGGSSERDPSNFFPIFVGLMGPPGREGEEPPPADRIVLVNPHTRGMVVLRAGAGGVDLGALMREILSADGPPPASKASIRAMRTVERPETESGGEDTEEECVVCLDGLWDPDAAEKDGAVKEMPCRHRFHGVCIDKWLGLHGSCPVCRHRMPEEERDGGKKGWEDEEEGEDEGERRRRTVDGEIWVTFGFGRTDDARGDGHHHHHQQEEEHQQPTEEID